MSPGFEVELTAPMGGAIFYTLNGPDPRDPDGTPHAEALAYTDPITINETTRIRARTRIGSSWSTVAERTYATEVVSLAMTEVMYNPRALVGDAFGKSLYEFVEFHNPSGEAVDLTGVVLLDPFFDFTNSSVTSARSW